MGERVVCVLLLFCGFAESCEETSNSTHIKWTNCSIANLVVSFDASKITWIDLSHNKIKSMPGNVTLNLEYLDLSHNDFNKITKDILGKIKVNQLDLSFNHLTTFKNNLFSNRTISILNLSHNAISEAAFGAIKLKVLDLSHNKLSAVDSDVFFSLNDLIELNLSGNSIKAVTDGAFANNKFLSVLNLTHNRISQFSAAIGQIRNLDLSHNFLNEISLNSTYLEVLNLSNNLIDDSCDVFRNLVKLAELNLGDNLKKKLRYLDLSGNQIEKLPEFISGASYDYLEFSEKFGRNRCVIDSPNNQTLIVTPGILVIDEIEVAVSGNSFDCDSYYSLIKKFKPADEILSICDHKRMGRIKKNCPTSCTCICSFNESATINCSHKNLTANPTLPQLEFSSVTVRLDGNLITVGPPEGNGYENVTELDLSDNLIEHIQWIPPRIKVLKLDRNNISRLSAKIVDEIENLNGLIFTIDGNVGDCECGSARLGNLLRNLSKKANPGSVFCTDNRELIDLNENDLCPNANGRYFFIATIVLTVLLVTGIVTALYFRFSCDLKAYLYANNNCLWWVSEEERDRYKPYDAFLCYSHLDEEFVAQTLVPVLEQGPDPYNLCIHVRNWVPGTLISKQIDESVAQSRRTVIVLSSNFLKSSWGRIEFHAAHNQRMKRGRHRVIVIMYGDVNLRGRRDKRLRAYIDKYTYIKWGHPRFWDNLRYALPHKRRNSNQTESNGV